MQALVAFREETWAALRAVRGDARVDLTGGGTRAGRSGDRVGAGGDRFVDVARAGGVDEGLRDGGVVGSVGTSSGVMWEPPAVWEPPAGSVADVVARLRGVPAVVDETGRAWPVSEVARALCDCVLTRAVVDAPNEDLMLGRGERLFTRAHWLALLAAGVTTCAVDGCQMPLAYTELHHITWWRDGGETTLANLAPECSYHHHETHRLGLTVTRRPDGSYEHRHPDGRPYGGMPRDDPDDGPPPVLSLYDTA